MPESHDENVIREKLSIPRTASREAFWRSESTPGTFGREGLRITATFKLDPADTSESILKSSSWKELPLPDILKSFPEGPVELPAIKSGRYFCTVWYSGDPTPKGLSPDKTIPCEQATLNATPFRDNFDSYQVAIFDPSSHRISVVAKNYF